MSGTINIEEYDNCELQNFDETHASSSEIEFELLLVLQNFKKCKGENGQIFLNDYLSGYLEVNKFFQILGSVFNFVASDVLNKINILQCYRNGGAGDYYYSIQSMIEYEKETESIRTDQSGSRHLLRLNRALEFLIGFLEELKRADLETKLSTATNKVYNQTLAKFHPWIVRKTVNLALLLMPTKQAIVEKVSKGNAQAQERTENLLPETIDVMKSVYSLVHKLYEEDNLLDLP